MKNFIFFISLLVSMQVLSAPSYTTNSFTIMPHYKIMELNINECKTQANARGNANLAIECIEIQKKSFEYLKRIHDAQDITSPSWSLCIGESKTEYSYDYMLMLGCMKVVKDICPEKADGNWVNPNMCINSIKSGEWIHNPKVFQPTKYSLKAAP